MSPSLADLGPSFFEPVVGTRLELVDEPSGLVASALELKSVDPLPSTVQGREQPFSILLEGDCDPRIPQGTYLFRHPALGDLPLFIVPIRERNGVRQYEAIFN